jgi:asparagine synthase (glutamine-hydrolysing)
MCGIVGIFSFDDFPKHKNLWPTLIEHLRHRGPDEGAWWSDGPFFFGHRRLSIIGLASGGQPMATKDGSLVVTFNGEIYNYPLLREQLENQGYNFTTDSDTEVLLHGYDAWGENLPRHLTGMFAFAIADRRRKELFIARDRFGEKPLYYLRSGKYFAFASELRSLVVLPECSRKINIQSLGSYLSLNYVLGNETMFQGISKLAPASWKILSQNGERSGSYWSLPSHEIQTPRSLNEVLEEWQCRFDRAVKLSLLSDVPVGIFLSGGMDSSLIAESAVRQGKLSAAYFIDFEELSYSEYESASMVAKRLAIPLHKTTLRTADLVNFFDIVEHGDDPLADSSALPMWLISKSAAKEVKVVLGGDGGDELFSGYLTYQASDIHRRYISNLPKKIRKLLANVSNLIPPNERKVSLNYKLWRFLRAADLPTSMAHFTWNGTWLPSEASSFVRTNESKKIIYEALAQSVANHFPNEKVSIFDLQRADSQEYLPNDIITKVDRMSMAHGLEVRAPFLEYELAEFALTLPQKFKLGKKLEGKVLLREAARRKFGNAIGGRPKQGFSIPIHEWIRGPLAEQVLDLLSPSSIKRMEFLDPEKINEVVKAHFSRNKSYGFELWGLAVLVAWHRQRIEKPPSPPPITYLKERKFNLVST